jgi:hypothetical protein
MSLVKLAACCRLAFLVMISGIDFLDFHDLFDPTELHHEHIVVPLLLRGSSSQRGPAVERGRDCLLMRSIGGPCSPDGLPIRPRSRSEDRVRVTHRFFDSRRRQTKSAAASRTRARLPPTPT